MLKQDKLLTGIIVGILFPVFAWVIFQEAGHIIMDKTAAGGFSNKFLAVISVATNALPAALYTKSKKDNALRGIIFVTFIFVFVVMIIFGKEFLNS